MNNKRMVGSFQGCRERDAAEHGVELRRGQRAAVHHRVERRRDGRGFVTAQPGEPEQTIDRRRFLDPAEWQSRRDQHVAFAHRAHGFQASVTRVMRIAGSENITISGSRAAIAAMLEGRNVPWPSGATTCQPRRLKTSVTSVSGRGDRQAVGAAGIEHRGCAPNAAGNVSRQREHRFGVGRQSFGARFTVENNARLTNARAECCRACRRTAMWECRFFVASPVPGRNNAASPRHSR